VTDPAPETFLAETMVAEPVVADPVVADPVAPEPEPEPEPVMAANDMVETPLIRPIVIGSAEAPPLEKKRGWWRR